MANEHRRTSEEIICRTNKIKLQKMRVSSVNNAHLVVMFSYRIKLLTRKK